MVLGNHERPSFDVIRKSLENAIEKALDKDWDIFALGGHEQAIAHRIAVYLEPEFPDYHIDCEYNRSKYVSKGYVGEFGEIPRPMRPDLIVHRRNTGTNVLAVEMKANANTRNSNDLKKLKVLKAEEEGYVYDAIAFIEIKNGIADLATGELIANTTWFNVCEEELKELSDHSRSLSSTAHSEEVRAIVARRKQEESTRRKRSRESK